MRNALVLVPLCIGLTSGFIVPTSTSEVYNFTQSNVTLKQMTTALDEEMIRNHSIDSMDIDLQLHNIKENDAEQELYNEGSEENKNIEERSFILVNQRWSKQPYKIHLVDTKLTNSYVSDHNLKKSYLHVFEEVPNVNVLPQVDAVHTRYLNNKQEQHKEYNKERTKRYPTTTQRIRSRIHANRGMNLKYSVENKLTDNKKHFVELLKTSVIRPSIKGIENTALSENIKNKYTKNKNKNHFIEFNKGSRYVEGFKNDNITKHHKERYENPPLYRDQIAMNETYVDIVTEQKLFHLLLEEQVPFIQTVHQTYNNSLSSYKYCRKCARLAKLSNSKMDSECDCRCGRYIHLKGRTEPKN